MQVIFDDPREEARFVALMHNGMCRLENARTSLVAGHDGHALATYYRVDTEIAARAYNMLPDDLKRKIEAGDEPPGK